MAGSPLFTVDRLRFLVSKIQQRLWIKPLVICALSVSGIFVARLADDKGLASVLPTINLESVETLLSIMASSMLVIATFAVGSMVAAYGSASSGATPRSIPLIIADDVTQNALSAFIGSFIFSLVSLIAVQNNLFGSAGLFAIFVLTLLVFTIVIITFVRWVDRIARLGRVVNTIEQVEKATCKALERRRHAPSLGALPISPEQASAAGNRGFAVCSATVGYIQHIDMEKLQACAEESRCRVLVTALPGTFVSRHRPLLRIEGNEAFQPDKFSRTFTISANRAFEDDPRFGLLALSEIADKALSPGVNDPGTAINVIGTMVRLFTLWQSPLDKDEIQEIAYDRISVPNLVMDDMLDDAFTAIARDGAGIVEVSIRLQKAFCALAESEDKGMVAAAKKHSRMALARSERAMTHPDDIESTRRAAAFSARQLPNLAA